MKKFYVVIALVIAGVIGSLAINPSSAADPRDVTITLRAADNISGVTMMQIAEDKNNPSPAVAFESVTVINTAANALWVRIQDRAGNWSTWVQIIVGADPYQDTANFNTIPTPTPTASATSDSGGGGGGGGGGFIGGGGFGGGGFIGGGGDLPMPETSTPASPSLSETKTVSATPSPSLSATPTPTPSKVVATPTPTSSPKPSPTPSSTASRPDLVRASAPAVSKALGGGLTQLSAAAAAKATVISSSPPAKNAKSAPTAYATVGAPVTSLVKALPSKSAITVTTVINGKTVTLGKVTTNSKGEVLLPAFSSSKAGTFTLAMKTAAGKIYYTKVKFSEKK